MESSSGFTSSLLLIILLIFMLLCGKLMKKGGEGCCGKDNNEKGEAITPQQLKAQLEIVEQQNKLLKREIENLRINK